MIKNSFILQISKFNFVQAVIIVKILFELFLSTTIIRFNTLA